MDSSVTPLFADAMALRPLDGAPGRYAGRLSADWTIGPNVHGGMLVALCANAARQAYAGDPSVQPVAISANFLSAVTPGEVILSTVVRKRGRRIGLVDVELVAGDRACVRAVVNLGDPEHLAEPLFINNPVIDRMSPQPPPQVPVIGPGHPAADINHLARGCDIRLLVSDSVGPGEAPAFQVWARPRLGEVDELFALMCGDISLPVPFAVGRRGWAPTVQLTAYLRGLPADGWLRVLCTTAQIGQDWFDEDHTVVDSAGRIVVQTRQLAMVPAQ